MLRPVALAAFTAFGAIAVIALGCQTYDFEPVTPLTLAQTTQVVARTAKRLKPNVMLLVDKSGSMLEPIDDNDSRCPANCGPTAPCPAACPTRVSDMRSAMSAFLSSSGTLARFGLTFFPEGTQCGAPSTMPTVSLPSATANDEGTDTVLGAKAAEISTRIVGVTPVGGTPTGASLSFVGTLGALTEKDDRDDVVLLLTDGLPNCNGNNANQQCTCNPTICGSCTSTAACAAQASSCRCTSASCTGGLCSLGCLDQDNTVSQIEQLLAKGIKTLVIGFGAETNTGDAALVLQAMGQAGGFGKFFQASNQAELQQILKEFSASLVREPCEFLLDDKPSDPRFIAVLVEGKNVPPGADTWSYVNVTDGGTVGSGGKVVFAPASSYCASMKASTSSMPVNVEVRFIQQL
jgi:hypothetical protein